jgi:hypothetical protein
MKYVVCVASFTLCATTVFAKLEYVSLIPNGDKVEGIAAVGHEEKSGGGVNNAFGSDFSAAGNSWTKELCEKDSDGDGATNGEELGDPCCEWRSGDTPKGSTATSPGHKDEFKTDALASMRCSSGQPTPGPKSSEESSSEDMPPSSSEDMPPSSSEDQPPSSSENLPPSSSEDMPPLTSEDTSSPPRAGKINFSFIHEECQNMCKKASHFNRLNEGTLEDKLHQCSLKCQQKKLKRIKSCKRDKNYGGHREKRCKTTLEKYLYPSSSPSRHGEYESSCPIIENEYASFLPLIGSEGKIQLLLEDIKTKYPDMLSQLKSPDCVAFIKAKLIALRSNAKERVKKALKKFLSNLES